jgi:glycogen(starch) synthase
MKVLMTTDGAGGVLTYCVQLASVLSAAGVDVVMASMGPRLSAAQRADVREAGAEVVEGGYRLEWMDDPWRDVERAGEWLLALEREHGPDVIQVNGYAHASLPWRAPAFLVAHSCVCSWWRAVLEESAPDRYARYRAEVTRALAAAQVTVAPSEAMLRCLVEQYGEPRRRLVIHNGIRLTPRPSGPKEPFVLSAGRVWDRAKNIVQLEHAAAGLAWPVFVAGDATGPDGGEAPGLSHAVALGVLGRGELGRWMQRASIFALPALYEPFGLSVLEAAVAGCALVLGDIPSLRELWGSAALYVHPARPLELRGALERLIGDPRERDRLGQAAFERAQRYGLQPLADRYLALYRSLAPQRRATLGAPELEMAR